MERRSTRFRDLSWLVTLVEKTFFSEPIHTEHLPSSSNVSAEGIGTGAMARGICGCDVPALLQDQEVDARQRK